MVLGLGVGATLLGLGYQNKWFNAWGKPGEVLNAMGQPISFGAQNFRNYVMNVRDGAGFRAGVVDQHGVHHAPGTVVRAPTTRLMNPPVTAQERAGFGPSAPIVTSDTPELHQDRPTA